MIKILWVEDGLLHTVAPAEVLDRVENGELDTLEAKAYLDALDEIAAPNLHERFDAIILDAHLEPLSMSMQDDLADAHPITYPLLSATLAEWYKCTDPYLAPEEFKSEAGYLLFRDLVLTYGFPAERIIFLSGHLDHLDGLLGNLKAAKIMLSVYSKSGVQTRASIGAIDEFVGKLARWEGDEYITLRRCVIDTTHHIEKLLQTKATFPFLDFLKERPHDLEDYREQLRLYLAAIRHSLPLSLGAGERLAHVLRSFLRAVTTLWENNASSANLKNSALYGQDKRIMGAIGSTLKSLRNRIAHNQIDGDFTTSGARMLFVAAMGVMFGEQAVEGQVPKPDGRFDITLTMERLRGKFARVVEQCEELGAKVYSVDRPSTEGQIVPAGEPSPLEYYGACLDYLCEAGGQRYGASQLTQLLWHNLFPRRVARGKDGAASTVGVNRAGWSDQKSLAKLVSEPRWNWLGELLQWEAGRCFL